MRVYECNNCQLRATESQLETDEFLRLALRATHDEPAEFERVCPECGAKESFEELPDGWGLNPDNDPPVTVADMDKTAQAALAKGRELIAQRERARR